MLTAQMDVLEMAHTFATIADGEFGMKNHVRPTDDGVSVSFHAGGYAEFCDDGRIVAVIDNDERQLVWDLFPSDTDFRRALKKFRSSVFG
jgi:hypothetical protein